MTDDRRASAIFTRHLQTGLTVIGVGLIGWVGISTQSAQVELGKLTVYVENLQKTITAPQPRVDDLMRRVEALEKIFYKNAGSDARPVLVE